MSYQEFISIWSAESAARLAPVSVANLTNSLWYSRKLPGGGFVVIEGLPADGRNVRAHVIVERRADSHRRPGHVPPVIARAEGRTRDDVYEELHRIASDNVAVANCIRQSRRRQ
jgi:hypothetical protein